MTRKITLSFLALVAAVALVGCKPLGSVGPANGDPSQHPSDPCGVDVARVACWGVAGPPGQHRAEAGQPAPGFRRVLVVIDSFDNQGRVLHVPVHTLAQGRTVSGSLAIDARTGSPFTAYEDITTPDAVYYDLGPGVVHLDVQAIRLGKAGDSLVLDTFLDGAAYPGGRSSAQNPTVMGGDTRTLMVRVVVNAPPL